MLSSVRELIPIVTILLFQESLYTFTHRLNERFNNRKMMAESSHPDEILGI
jgi:hypothetical protein